MVLPWHSIFVRKCHEEHYVHIKEGYVKLDEGSFHLIQSFQAFDLQRMQDHYHVLVRAVVDFQYSLAGLRH